MAKRRKKRTRPQNARQPQPTEQPVQAVPRGPRWHMLLPILVVLAGVAVYWNGLDTEFLLDDDQNIVRSERIRDLSAIGEILAVKRPLVELSLALNYYRARLHVTGYHVFNLTIHLLAGLTLFGIVRRTLLLPSLRERYGKGAAWLALAVSLIWVVHPLQTESVTYTIQRAESMMGLFYLLTLYCLILSVQSSHRRWWFAAAALSAGLGMGSKAIIITAPAVVLLYDRIFVAGSFVEVVRRRWLFHAGVLGAILSVGLATGVLRYVMRAVNSPQATARFSFRAQEPADYIVTQPSVVLHYLKLSFWPDELCLDYRWRPATEAKDVIPPAIAIFALLAATGYALARKPALGFIGAWFFIILAPTSCVWTLELAFEHRMYLSLAAVVVLAVFAGHASIRALSAKLSLPEWMGWALAAGLVVAVTAALGYRTTVRNRDYESRFTMNQAVVAVRPDNDRAHYNLANAWKKKGEIEKAIAAYKEAIRINPRHANAMCNLANRYVDQGRTEEAIAEFHRVLRLNPRHARGLYNLGNALFNHSIDTQAQGMEEKAKDLLKEATGMFRRSRQVRPRHTPTLHALALALYGQNQYDEAEEVLLALLKIKPDDEWAQRTLDQLRTARNRSGMSSGTAGDP